METTEKLNKAMLAALKHNDQKLAAKLADTILKYDINHESAWLVVYTLTGSQEDFNTFKENFTQKYYSNANRIVENAETTRQSNENTAITFDAVSPEMKKQNDQQDGITCNQCGRLNKPQARFCGFCGERLFSKKPSPFPPQEPASDLISPSAASPMTMEHHNVSMKEIFAKPEETPAMPRLRSEGLQQQNPSTDHAATQEMQIKPIEQPPDTKQVSTNLTSKDETTVLQALESIRRFKMMELVPQVLSLILKNHFYHQGTDCHRAAFGLMDEMGSAEQWVTLEKFIKPDHLRILAVADTVAPALYRRKYREKAIKVLKYPLGLFGFNEFQIPAEINPILAASQMPEPVIIKALIDGIPQTIKTYDPKLEIGWLLVWSSANPILLLVTGALTITGNIIHNVSMRQRMYADSLAASTWMIDPEILRNINPQQITKPVAMMLILHAYATSLSFIGAQQPRDLAQAVENNRKPIQQAVLGLAQANNGIRSARNVLQSVATDGYWPVRILAYEGLVTLREKTNDALYPAIMDGLTDKDIRVALATASIMIATERPEYKSAILSQLGSMDKDRRMGMLIPTRELAVRGDQAARQVLEKLSRTDPDEKVRTCARDFLKNPLNPNP